MKKPKSAWKVKFREARPHSMWKTYAIYLGTYKVGEIERHTSVEYHINIRSWELGIINHEAITNTLEDAEAFARSVLALSLLKQERSHERERVQAISGALPPNDRNI